MALIFFATRKMPIELSGVIRDASVHVFGSCSVNKAQIAMILGRLQRVCVWRHPLGRYLLVIVVYP